MRAKQGKLDPPSHKILFANCEGLGKITIISTFLKECFFHVFYGKGVFPAKKPEIKDESGAMGRNLFNGEETTWLLIGFIISKTLYAVGLRLMR